MTKPAKPIKSLLFANSAALLLSAAAWPIGVVAQERPPEARPEPRIDGGPATRPVEPGGPGGFGPGMFLGDAFMTALDANKDGSITLEECKAGFDKWFNSWNSDIIS